MGAELAHQPLRHHAVDGGGDQEGLDAHVDQPPERAGGVAGVQGGEHHVAGERGLDRDVGGLAVADLTRP